MSPAAALVGLILAWVVVVVLGVRRDRRRIDPLALTDDELAALVDRHGDREVGR